MLKASKFKKLKLFDRDSIAFNIAHLGNAGGWTPQNFHFIFII